MEKLKVVAVNSDEIQFENNMRLFSEHLQDCCESHYLDFSDLTIQDFDGLFFDLSGNGFFERVEGYGIKLKPINGHDIPVPGYGYNNGYYSHELTLHLVGDGFAKSFDISDCQKIKE